MHSGEDLSEAAFDLGRRHATSLDCGVEIATGTKLHNLAPVQILILHKVDRLNDVDMVECRRYAELCCELLDVLLLCLVLSPFPELLRAAECVSASCEG